MSMNKEALKKEGFVSTTQMYGFFLISLYNFKLLINNVHYNFLVI